MKRRTVLAGIGTGAASAFAGCLDGGVRGGLGGDGGEPGDSDDDGDEDDGGTGDGEDGTDGSRENGDGPSVPEPDGECGPEVDPLSTALVAEPDQEPGTCPEDVTPSFVVANERAEAVTATVEIESDGETAFESSYDLGPGERAVERGVARADELGAVTVSLGDGESDSGEWPEPACYRHAAVLTDDGLEAGYVPPLSGPGDTQHDCYAGDSVPIALYDDGAGRTATVTVVDHCRESVDVETVELEAEGVERLEDALTNGGRYDVVVDVADGGDAVEEFYDACWGLSVSIDADGDPEIGPIEVD